MTAGPFVKTLAEDVVGVAHDLRDGNVVIALELLEASTDRLQRFLTFLLVASELMVESEPTFGAIIADYSRRLLQTTQQIDLALGEEDVHRLSEVLEYDLARGLNEYRDYESGVRRVFTPRAAA